MLPATHRNSNSAWLPSVLGDFFDDNFFTFTPARQFASPAVNILENEKQFEIEVAAPGMTRNDFNIHLENDAELVISLEKKSDKEDNCGKEDKKCKEEKRNYLRREFSYASYRQSFSIPEEVDVESISAEMSNGILHITLPKKVEVVNVPASRKIDIR